CSRRATGVACLLCFGPHCGYPFYFRPGQKNRSRIPRNCWISFHSVGLPPVRCPDWKSPPIVVALGLRLPAVALATRRSAAEPGSTVPPIGAAIDSTVPPIGVGRNSAGNWLASDLAGCWRCYIAVAATRLCCYIVGSAKTPRCYTVGSAVPQRCRHR